MTAQEICKKLQQIHKTSYEIFLQNGKEAGQSVYHVHLHLIPHKGPIEGLERKEDDIRSEEDMAREAEQYRSCFEQSNQ
jgi:bis(5'-adenosyl)-triphosphatase